MEYTKQWTAVVSYPLCLRYFPGLLHVSADRPTLVGVGFVFFPRKVQGPYFQDAAGGLMGFLVGLMGVLVLASSF